MQSVRTGVVERIRHAGALVWRGILFRIVLAIYATLGLVIFARDDLIPEDWHVSEWRVRDVLV